MTKRSFSILLALALVAGIFGTLPAKAQTTIPDVVQIDDPKGDANFLNDQDNAYGTPLAGQGDHVTPADIGNATDLMKVWFSNTATEISLNFQTEGNPNLLAYDTYFRFSSNAGQGPVANDTTRGCLQWVASINGAGGAYTGPTEGALTDKCNVGTVQTGALVTAPGPEGFITTMTFPRSYSPLLADGSSITAPFGVARIVYVGNPPAPTVLTAATIDNTKRGTDYVITGGGPIVQPPPDPKEEPPGKSDPPGKGKKKGCPKGKGKKKGACPGKPKPPAVPACPAYVPGEQGAEAETTIVTDAATEEKPVELEFDAGRGLGGPLIGGVPVPPDQTKHNYHNVQIDSQAAEVGLYLRLEFPDRRDYDLYLLYPDGSEASHSGDFNPVHEALSCGAATTQCQSGSNFESINGIKTSDCQGWTVDSVAYLTEGGKVKLKMWLGEIKGDPAAPAGEGESAALATFFSLLGL